VLQNAIPSEEEGKVWPLQVEVTVKVTVPRAIQGETRQRESLPEL
jgi:hypothetical protein